MIKKHLTSRIIFCAVLAFTSIVVSCSSDNSSDEIELNWKLNENDSLVYLTAMEEVGESSYELDTDGLFDELLSKGDEPGIDPGDIGEFLSNSLKEKIQRTDMITILSNSKDFKDVLDIEMVALEKTDANFGHRDSAGMDVLDDIGAFIQSMVKGTMLRGSINKDGSMHSFWVKTSQKNLISIFFELPKGKLKKGDSWELNNISFIQNDQNFKCQKAESKNVVKLVDIKEVKGETIAVIEYNIEESVSGDFSRKSFFGDGEMKKPTTMKYTFKARAEFSVDQGKWVTYAGIMSTETTGFINSVQHQKFVLVEK